MYFCKTICQIEQVHISLGEYFSNKIDENRFLSIMMVSRDLSCSAPEIKIYTPEKKLIGIIQKETENFYTDPKFDYKRKSFIFSIPKNWVQFQNFWRIGKEEEFRNFPNKALQKEPKYSKWIVVADLDQSEGGRPTLDALFKLNPNKYDGLIHTGDYAYDIHDNYGELGDEFFNIMSKLTSKIPYIAIPGNHENHNEFRLFNYRFKMPGSGDSMESGSNYFSFNLKGVHFMAINWDWVFKIDPLDEKKQDFVFNWLKNDLEKYSKDPNINFLIFLSHRPFNCSFDDKDCFIFYNLRKYKGLLRKYKVELILTAHKHKYFRFKKLSVDFDIEPEDSASPLQIINGKAGCKNPDVYFLPYAQKNKTNNFTGDDKNFFEEEKETIDDSDDKGGPMDAFSANEEPYWLELEITEKKISGNLIASSSGEKIDYFEAVSKKEERMAKFYKKDRRNKRLLK